jgi:hypothetical protein
MRASFSVSLLPPSVTELLRSRRQHFYAL